MATLDSPYAPWGRVESELFRKVSELLQKLEEEYSEAGLTAQDVISNLWKYCNRHHLHWYSPLGVNAATASP
jgi:hypothetical protein